MEAGHDQSATDRDAKVVLVPAAPRWAIGVAAVGRSCVGAVDRSFVTTAAVVAVNAVFVEAVKDYVCHHFSLLG